MWSREKASFLVQDVPWRVRNWVVFFQDWSLGWRQQNVFMFRLRFLTIYQKPTVSSISQIKRERNTNIIRYLQYVLKTTSNFQETTIRPIVPRYKHSIIFILHQKIQVSSALQFKNHIEFFSLYRWKPLQSNEKFEEQNRQKPT